MNRSIIVSLLKKNIDELILLTEGFSEMTHYPEAILHLAKNKTSDIRTYIDMLADVEKAPVVPEIIDAEPIAEKLIEPGTDETVVPEEIRMETVAEHEIIEKVNDKLPVLEDLVDEIIVPEDLYEVKPIEIEDEEEPENDVVEEEEDEENDDDDEIVIEIEAPDESEKSELIEVQVSETTPEETKENIVEAKAEPVIEIPKITTLGDKLTSNGISRNDLHTRPEMTGIHASIANKKVEDVRQAISLGDRFRFQRELFKNNGEEMNKMLSYINQLATYDEVVSFLKSKYAWPEDHDVANDFYQLVKRKF